MIILYNIYILACFTFVFTSGENFTSFQDPTKSITVAFPGRLCGDQIMIEGAVMFSSKGAYDFCTLRFSPMVSHKDRKLMLKFTHYNVTDCSVSLNIYNRLDSSGDPAVTFGCKNSPPPSYLLGGQHLKLQLSKRTVTGYDFGIVITAFSEYTYRGSRQPKCDAFLCGKAHPMISMCIETSLLCDGVVNCFDELDSDETKGCEANGTFIGGSSSKTGPTQWWPIITVVVFLVIVGFIGRYVYRKYCRNRSSSGNASRNQAAASQQAEQQSGLLVGNASSGHVITLQQPIYSPDGTAQLPPLTSPGQLPYPEQPYYPMSQTLHHVQGFTDVPGRQQPEQQPPPTIPGQPSFHPQQPLPQSYHTQQPKTADI